MRAFYVHLQRFSDNLGSFLRYRDLVSLPWGKRNSERRYQQTSERKSFLCFNAPSCLWSTPIRFCAKVHSLCYFCIEITVSHLLPVVVIVSRRFVSRLAHYRRWFICDFRYMLYFFVSVIFCLLCLLFKEWSYQRATHRLVCVCVELSHFRSFRLLLSRNSPPLFTHTGIFPVLWDMMNKKLCLLPLSVIFADTPSQLIYTLSADQYITRKLFWSILRTFFHSRTSLLASICRFHIQHHPFKYSCKDMPSVFLNYSDSSNKGDFSRENSLFTSFSNTIHHFPIFYINTPLHHPSPLFHG